MFNKGDIIILDNDKDNPIIAKILNFTNIFGVDYAHTKNLETNMDHYLPLSDLKLYKTYYRLHKLKKIMENV